MERFQHEMQSDQYIIRYEIKDPIWEDLLHKLFVDEHPKCRQDSQKYGNYLVE